MSASVERTCARMLALRSETMRLTSRSTPGTFLCTLSTRWPSRGRGQLDLGEVHGGGRRAVVERSETASGPTSRPMASCASSVEPPMCGVRITLGEALQLARKPSLLLSGSSGTRRWRRPRGARERSAVRQRRDVHDGAAARVEQVAPRLHEGELAPRRSFCVCGVAGTCSVTKSDARSRLRARLGRLLPIGSFVAMSK
jgi:hypothetical protein